VPGGEAVARDLWRGVLDPRRRQRVCDRVGQRQQPRRHLPARRLQSAPSLLLLTCRCEISHEHRLRFVLLVAVLCNVWQWRVLFVLRSAPVPCAATGTASTIRYTVPVAGNPGHPIFYPKNGGDNETTFAVRNSPCRPIVRAVCTRRRLHTCTCGGCCCSLAESCCPQLSQEYLVFFPLTRNTNKANIAAGGRCQWQARHAATSSSCFPGRQLSLAWPCAAHVVYIIAANVAVAATSGPMCGCCSTSKHAMRCAAVAALGADAPGDVTSPDYPAEPFDCEYAPATALDAANTAGTDTETDT
jgi:hypothetical protein